MEKNIELEEARALATEILRQVRFPNICVYLSWGVSARYIIKDGLRLKVNGRKLSGFVDIILDYGTDTYIVNFLKKNGEVVDTVDDVYFDNLQDIIDRRIESC